MAERSFSISRRFVSFVVTRSQLVDKLQVLVRLAVQLEIGFVRRLLGAQSAQVVAADREQSLVLPLRAGQPIRQRRRKTRCTPDTGARETDWDPSFPGLSSDRPVQVIARR